MAGITWDQFAGGREIDSTVVASDVTDQEMLVLNARSSPDLPLAQAVRMSMSIPFVWQEAVWHRSWGSYRGWDITGHSVVDGRVLSNFPIRLISEESDEAAGQQAVETHLA